jgi:Bor protein
MNSKTLICSLGTMRAVAALAGLLALAGCAEYHLSTPSLSPAPGEYRQSMNAYVWGLVLDPQVVSAEDCKYGIDDVFIERNFGQDLASVVTLGLWMPAEVRYHCKAQGTRGGSIPEPPANP